MISLEDIGITPQPRESIMGGNAEANAQIIEAVLNGERGPRRDVVLLNAAVAIMAGGAAENLREAIRVAAHSIDSGAARGKLIALREFVTV
jgi:anthranilate phosphoribosyltransferase